MFRVCYARVLFFMFNKVKFLFHPNGKKWLALFCLGLCAASSLGGTFTVSNIADSGAGSLRQAISDANGNPGPNNIVFHITGSSPFTITLLSALPAVGTPTVIDATTQTGFTSAPLVELNGASAGANVAGLQLLAGSSTVRGLAINRFSAQGIILSGPTNVVQGNYIGTDVTGTIARGNTSFGVWVQSAGNLVGGTNAGNGNLISGGNDTGVYIISASGNTLQGNLIGVAASGAGALGNINNGVVLDGSGGSCSGNLIGGTNSGARNVISGNGLSGVYLNGSGATGNSVQGNYIGLGKSGEITVANGGDGVTVNSAPGNTIGGGNVISGNTLAGISLNNSAASGNLILGNFIGIDAAGKLALGNLNAGVVVFAAVGNQIGGTNSASGNVISGNAQDGIFVAGGSAGNLVQGNFLGLSAAGTNALPNGISGISLDGAVSNTIGGVVAGARNVISGNTQNGVGILQLGDAGNVVLGNDIGTDVTGRNAVPNTLAGVRIQGCSNVIGGVVTGSGNLISGNGQQGVWLVGVNGSVSGNTIQGNLIGLDATGVNALPNGNAGVGITSASGNQIGGTVSGARNVISANGDAGIFFISAGTSGNQVQGNFIGTDATGTLARGNLYEGIYMQDVATNLIGGSAAGAGNLISGNNSRGLWLTDASWTVIQGNFIGTTADGNNALGNVFHGIDLDVNSTNNTVGGTAAGAGNRIAFAQSIYCGVRVRDGSANNLISGNAIFGNGALGIDLGNYGPNPVYDCESGIAAGAANAGQNFPVLTDAYSGGGATRIRGTLDSASGKTYLLQFFASPAGDPSGYGEGQMFLGQTYFALEGACSASFTVSLPVSVPSNWVVSATATSPPGNASGFFDPGSFPVPSLQFALAGASRNQLSFSWTNNGGNLLLQQTASLSPPVQWTTVAVAPSLVNGFYVVTTPVSGAAFYRLTPATAPISVPSLQIAPAGANRNRILLSWTNNGGNFLLQQTASLSPSAQWTAFAGTPSVTNGFFMATAPATSGSAFYRLSTAAAATTSPAGNTSEFSAWVSTVPVPSLQLALAGANRNQVSLSWANNGGNFLLQQTASLTPPVQWSTVAAAPSLVNGFYVVTAPPTNGSAFYRLTAQ
jgi:titin